MAPAPARIQNRSNQKQETSLVPRWIGNATDMSLRALRRARTYRVEFRRLRMRQTIPRVFSPWNTREGRVGPTNHCDTDLHSSTTSRNPLHLISRLSRPTLSPTVVPSLRHQTID